MGRDGSGIRMIMWAGGTMEAGPRAGMSIGKNGAPGFAFGGAWPCFGPEGKRVYNESMYKFGSNGYLDTFPDEQLLVNVTDANWETYLFLSRLWPRDDGPQLGLHGGRGAREHGGVQDGQGRLPRAFVLPLRQRKLHQVGRRHVGGAGGHRRLHRRGQGELPGGSGALQRDVRGRTRRGLGLRPAVPLPHQGRSLLRQLRHDGRPTQQRPGHAFRL